MIRILAARRVLFLVTALYSAAAAAADAGAQQSIEQRQIQALQRQLAAVQAQMKQLAEQNRTLLCTVGANFYTKPHVVFKADYQWFDLNAAVNRFDLGLGLNF